MNPTSSPHHELSNHKAIWWVIAIAALVGIFFPVSSFILFGDLFSEFVWVDPRMFGPIELVSKLQESSVVVRNALIGYAVAPLMYLPVAMGQYLVLKSQRNPLASAVLIFSSLAALGMAVGIARWPVLWSISHEFSHLNAQVLAPMFNTIDWLFGVVIEQFVGEFFWALWMGATAIALWGQTGSARVLCYLSLLACIAQIPGTFRSLYPDVSYLNTANEYILPLWAITAGVWMALYLKDLRKSSKAAAITSQLS